MDVDTPPRPTPFTEQDCQPPPNSFHFTADPLPPSHHDETTPFDTEQLLPPDAFSLAPDTPTPGPSTLLSTVSQAQEGRRRRWGRRDKSPDRSTASNPSLDDRDDDGDNDRVGAMDGVVGNRMRNGEFSFQVHHHHGASSEDRSLPLRTSPVDTGSNKNTPYVLLGSVFASHDSQRNTDFLNEQLPPLCLPLPAPPPLRLASPAIPLHSQNRRPTTTLRPNARTPLRNPRLRQSVRRQQLRCRYENTDE